MLQHDDIIAALRPLPHAHELQSYLLDFTAGLTGKKKLPAGYAHNTDQDNSTFVRESDLNAVIETICDIYRTEGYLKPWDLENAVIRRYHPNIPAKALSVADHFAAETMEPDHLTGYYSKDHVPMMMSLAALFHKATGKPVKAIELDLSNMRGTNENFARLLATAENRMPQSVLRDAEMMTDHITLIVCNAITRKLEEKYPGQVYIPLRTGGDEARILLPYMEADDAEKLLHEIHEEIETVTASIGQHDHAHGKHPDEQWANGFGAGGAIFDVNANGHNAYSDDIKNADHAIQGVKQTLGHKRINNAAYNALKPFASTDPERYSNRETASLHIMAVTQAMAEQHQRLINDTPQPDTIPRLEAMAQSLRPDHFLTMKQIQQEFRSHLSHMTLGRGVSLSAKQEQSLLIKIKKFPAQDYATGTLSARDFPPMAGASLQVIDDINKRQNTNEKPIIMGVSFHNLAGLNEALGHELANMTLRHMATNIIQKSCAKAGIASENVVLAHMGGGEFRAIIQPVIPEADGTLRVISDTDLAALQRDIRKNLAGLNNCHITDFLAFNGYDAGDMELPEKFSDIINPRAEMRPHENGLVATIVTERYTPDESRPVAARRKGGILNYHLGQAMISAVADRREREAQAGSTEPSATAQPQLKLF